MVRLYKIYDHFDRTDDYSEQLFLDGFNVFFHQIR